MQEETLSVAHTHVEKTVEAKKDTSNVKSQEIASEKLQSVVTTETPAFVKTVRAEEVTENYKSPVPTVV